MRALATFGSAISVEVEGGLSNYVKTVTRNIIVAANLFKEQLSLTCFLRKLDPGAGTKSTQSFRLFLIGTSKGNSLQRNRYLGVSDARLTTKRHAAPCCNRKIGTRVLRCLTISNLILNGPYIIS